VISARDAASSKARVVAAFDASARTYDEYGELQLAAARRLAATLMRCARRYPWEILELGCGTGFLTAELLDAFQYSRVLATDAAPAMLAAARAKLADRSRVRWALRDGERIEEPGRFDCVAAGLVFQWFEDPLRALTEHVRRSPLVAISVPVDGTFGEWIDAHERIGSRAATIAFPRASELERASAEGGATEITIELETRTRHFPSAIEFARVLRGVGARTPRAGCRAANLRAVDRAFPGGIVARYELAYLVAQW
jgi:malonyl-CoA O-methyltransferase